MQLPVLELTRVFEELSNDDQIENSIAEKLQTLIRDPRLNKRAGDVRNSLN